MANVGSDAPRVPAGLTPERARRWLLLRTLRDLRLSVAHGRPIALPNLVRLHRRRAIALMHEPGVPGSDVEILRQIYRSHQPFDATIPRLRSGPTS